MPERSRALLLCGKNQQRCSNDSAFYSRDNVSPSAFRESCTTVTCASQHVYSLSSVATETSPSKDLPASCQRQLLTRKHSHPGPRCSGRAFGEPRRHRGVQGARRALGRTRLRSASELLSAAEGLLAPQSSGFCAHSTFGFGVSFHCLQKSVS